MIYGYPGRSCKKSQKRPVAVGETKRNEAVGYHASQERSRHESLAKNPKKRRKNHVKLVRKAQKGHRNCQARSRQNSRV